MEFGGGKVIRDGTGQSQRTRAEGAVDTFLTNALIVDHSCVYKPDAGLRDGCIHGIGKAGNPGRQPAVTVVIGPEVIAARAAHPDSGGAWTRIFVHPPANGGRT